MYKRILIATDGSKIATKGLNHGLTLAKALKVPATIVTATETWSAIAMAHDVERHVNDPIGQYEKSAAAAAKKILAAAGKAAKKLGVSHECLHAADQHPAESILKTAKSKRCSLIVMASHGRRGIRRALLGSVAAEVLSNSTIPVLIVK
ncbi:MAG: universal stress protein [Rhodospirillales bacterium]